ncbi:hypothetical protein SAMN05216228_105411 [Rhizobium tibeticum]|uniref:Uncharacterized protein n=1 Tax=Rhizobium tibeticum TaxID=501024 RepID=A0A1H8W545_9HYPH|nr:hypothetical protein [Rhizobium tibeticum]SEI20147.1 hypothetical protein RTCCBAU85039_6325 [Rhizobium tibeticum]SEP22762.1 hypothetical protein SAMN05216228_105411 [Rhizobium tibeticum]
MRDERRIVINPVRAHKAEDGLAKIPGVIFVVAVAIGLWVIRAPRSILESAFETALFPLSAPKQT